MEESRRDEVSRGNPAFTRKPEEAGLQAPAKLRKEGAMKKQGRSGRPGAAGEVRAGGQGAHFRNIDSIPDPRPAGRGALGFCPAHPEELGTNCWSPLRRRREEAPLLVGPPCWALGRPNLCLFGDPCDISVTPSQMTRDSGRTDTQLVRPGPDEDAGLLPPPLPPAAPGLHKSRGLGLPARPGPARVLTAGL